MVKVRDGRSVQRKACYLVMAITMDGQREVLGMWFQQTEGAKFWMQVLSLRYVPRREYEKVVKDLKPLYTATDPEAAEHALEAFKEKWGEGFPPIAQAWRDAWEYVIQRTFPQRGGRPQTDLPSHHQRHPQVDQGRRLDESPPGVQDPLRRPTTRLTAHTVSRSAPRVGGR